MYLYFDLYEKSMKHCIEIENKVFWNCETSDAELFICECCSYTPNEECRDRYFKKAFLIHKDIKSIPKSQDYIDYHYIDEDDSTSFNSDIKHLKELYEECKDNNISPFWCEVRQDYKTTTICGCNSLPHQKKIGLGHFNTSDIWNEYACEITKEYNDSLQNQYFYNIISSFFWSFFIILLLLVFIYIIYIKVKGKIFKANSSDDNVLIPE